MHCLRELVQSAEYFLGTVGDHNHTQRQAHDQQGKGLEAIEVSQIFLRGIRANSLPQGRDLCIVGSWNFH
jgi:hypothetical protein